MVTRFLSTALRPLCVLTGAALLMLAEPVRADLPGPDGFSFGDPIAWNPGALFVHPQKKQFVLRSSNQLVCMGPDVLTPDTINDLTYGSHGLQATVRAGTDDFYAFAWGYDFDSDGIGGAPDGFAVYRGRCGESSTLMLALPPGAAGLPPALDKQFAGGLSSTANGTVYLPTVDGFYTLSLDALGPPAPFVTRAEILAALAAFSSDPYPWTTAPLVEPFYIASATLDGAGRLIALLAQPIDGETATWLVGIDPDKTITVLGEPAVTRAATVVATTIVWSPVLGATLLDCNSLLCVVDSSGAALHGPRPPWLARNTPGFSIANFVPSTGEPFVQFVDYTLRPMLFDATRVDADRDGLPLAKELAAGLSDLDDDGDDDGVFDGTELRLFATDPKDPASGPARTLAAPKLAASMRINDWSLLRDRMVEVHGLAHAGVWPGAVCHRIKDASGYRCLNSDGAPVAQSPFDYATAPNFTAGLTHALLGHQTIDLATGNMTSTGAKPDTALTPGFGATTFQRVDDDQRVVRYRNGETFAVIDLGRPACPLLGSADEQNTRCSDPAEEMLDISHVDPAGYHAPTASTLFTLHTHTRGAWLVAVNDTRAERVAHVQAFENRQKAYFAPLGDGKTALGMFAEYNGSKAFARTIDQGFRPVGEAYGQEIMVPQSGVWFRHGLLHLTSYAFYAVPPSTSDESGGCVSAGDIALCGFDSPVQMPDYTHLMYVHQEWVPVPDVLEPGEALFFANARNVGGGTWVTASEADWALWRLTRLGGAHRWLDRAAFEALMDTAGKSAIANEPLGPVVSIGVRDDARRVCLVETPASGKTRLWQLALDGAADAPTALTLEETGSASACAYAQGAMVVLDEAGAGSELRLADGTKHALSIPEPSGLVAIDGGWLVWGRTGQAACVLGGSVQPSPASMVAAGFQNGLVYSIDAQGMPWVAELGAVCGGGGKSEALTERVFSEHPLSLWSLSSMVGSVALKGGVKRAHLAVGPTGHVLFATEGLGHDSASSFYRDRLWRLRPSYTPFKWANRIEKLDPLRHEKFLMGFETILAENLTALTIVPWTNPEPADWEYLGLTPPPPYVGGTDPGDLPPIPWPEKEEEAMSCGCRTAPSESQSNGVLITLLLAFMAAWSRTGRARYPQERSLR